MKRYRSVTLILFILVAYYLILSAGSDFVHNHEPDSEFHDNCPACQWQTLSQDDFSGAGCILNILDDPLGLIGLKPCIQSIELTTNICALSNLSRAPPLPE